MSKINEKELKELFNNVRDAKTFEKLYSKYNNLVYGIAFSILKNRPDSEDVMQIVFAKIYSTKKEKMPTKKQASWLYTLTKNEAISLLRKKKKYVDIENVYEIPSDNNEIEKVIDKEEYTRLMEKLSAKEREIVSLKIISNLSFEQIAKLLNEPTGTVKWRYYKSVHTLKLLLSNFAMFGVAFVIGIKTLFKKEKVNNMNKENIDNENQDINAEETKNGAEQIKGEIESIKDNIEQNEEKQETLIEVDIEKNNVNGLGIGLLSVSAIFLILTIILSIFLIKYQLKSSKKTSK
jgi:RNA polymerase sigma factor (sigma-70 family)